MTTYRMRFVCFSWLIFAFLTFTAVPASADSAGGSDVLITESTTEILSNSTVAVASDGTIYAAVNRISDDLPNWVIDVYRSTDGGATWSAWDFLGSMVSGEHFVAPQIVVAEGTEDLVFLSWSRLGTIYVGHKTFDGASGDFEVNQAVALSQPGAVFQFHSMTTDAANYNSYYVFVVAETQPGATSSIWYSRSINRGDTFSLNLSLAEVPGPGTLKKPKIAYGFGGFLHVTWTYQPDESSHLDSSPRYRRGTSSGSTIGSWGPTLTLPTLQPTGETVFGRECLVSASPTSNDVAVTFVRFALPEYPWDYLNPGVYVSHDQGVSFTDRDTFVTDEKINSTLVSSPTTSSWYHFTEDDRLDVQQIPWGDATAWTETQQVSDFARTPEFLRSSAAAVDPTRGDRFVTTWVEGSGQSYSLWFDAEAHADPGYPNLFPGFPVSLPARTYSAPGLADLDRNGDQEIIWGDQDGNIQVYDHDGTPHPGWPQLVDGGLSHCPIAVGDLNDNGNLTVVAGSADGFAWAFDSGGNFLWKRQVRRFVNEPVYVSIGALGPPYPRQVVMASGPWVRFAKHDGEYIGGTPAELSTNVEHPIAIGNVNENGSGEYVVAAGLQVLAGNLQGEVLFDTTVDDTVSAAIALADLELDGDLEIIVPTQYGVLHVLDKRGDPFGPGWPTESLSDASQEITGVALANVRGNDVPEIAVTVEDFLVHLLYADGTSASGFPFYAGHSNPLNSGPILGPIVGSVDILVATSTGNIWAWDNFGSVNTGWPIDSSSLSNFPPVLGDIDGDGLTEIAHLSWVNLKIYDVQDPFDDPSFWYWPMAGYDAQRTSCLDCFEDLVTAVEEDTDNITRVSFARPAPNPLSGPCEFRYAVPERAVVNLEIFNLRGQRVAVVHRQESTPGRHVVSWNGRDHDNRPLSSGTYFARLTVRGPGVHERLTRKLVVLR